jgi:DNA-binding response OmpR family regulator
MAISGFIDENEVKELKAHGFDDYLKKPFSAEELQARVKALFEFSPSKSTQPKKIRSTP